MRDVHIFNTGQAKITTHSIMCQLKPKNSTRETATAAGAWTPRRLPELLCFFFASGGLGRCGQLLAMTRSGRSILYLWNQIIWPLVESVSHICQSRTIWEDRFEEYQSQIYDPDGELYNDKQAWNTQLSVLFCFFSTYPGYVAGQNGINWWGHTS